MEMRLVEITEILSAQSFPRGEDIMSCLMQVERMGLAAVGKYCSAKQHLGFKHTFELLPIG